MVEKVIKYGPKSSRPEIQSSFVGQDYGDTVDAFRLNSCDPRKLFLLLAHHIHWDKEVVVNLQVGQISEINDDIVTPFFLPTYEDLVRRKDAAF